MSFSDFGFVRENLGSFSHTAEQVLPSQNSSTSWVLQNYRCMHHDCGWKMSRAFGSLLGTMLQVLHLLIILFKFPHRLTDASISKVAKSCHAIQVLQLNSLKYAVCPSPLTHNRQITDASLIQLANHCHSLQRLQLDSCRQLTKEALMEVKKSCPLVEISHKF